ASVASMIRGAASFSTDRIDGSHGGFTTVVAYLGAVNGTAVALNTADRTGGTAMVVPTMAAVGQTHIMVFPAIVAIDALPVATSLIPSQPATVENAPAFLARRRRRRTAGA